MHFFTSIYGEKYLPFLRVFLRSLTETQRDFQLTVAWDDLPALEIDLLSQHFPEVRFQRCSEGVEDVSNVHQRIPMKLRYWMNFLDSVDEGTSVGFLDVDTMLMQDISDSLPADADVVFTWKAERFPLNTGVILARNTPATRAFMNSWLAETNSIIADSAKLKNACNTYGAADQTALAQLLPQRDFTSPSEKDFGGGIVRFCPAACDVLNETNSKPISPRTKLYHLKSGWHRILLEDGNYTKWRTEEDCEQIRQRWLAHDIETTVDSWREFCLQTAEKYAKQFSDEVEDSLEDGILNSEMLAVISMLNELKIDTVIESGRNHQSVSTILAAATQTAACDIHLTGAVWDSIAADAEHRLSSCDNVQLHPDDAADVVPRILSELAEKRVAILLDASAGPEIFDLLSRTIADHDHVVLGFIHRLRESYPGMLNPNRDLVHDYFERVFLTDDGEFVEKFHHLDEACKAPGVWEPHCLGGRRIGSYGPTLGVIYPTHRDRVRARKRMAPRTQRRPTADPSPVRLPAASLANPLKKLHRIPGYSYGRDLLKKGLKRETTAEIRNGAKEPSINEQISTTPDCKVSGANIAADDIVVLCGANSVEDVARIAQKGAMTHVFETNAREFSDLVQRFRNSINVVLFPIQILNREEANNCLLEDWSDEQEVECYIASSLPEAEHSLSQTLSNNLCDLIGFCGKTIKLVKLDLDGAEYPILQKLIQRGFIQYIEHVVVEAHAWEHHQLQPEHDSLVKLIESKSIRNIKLLEPRSFAARKLDGYQRVRDACIAIPAIHPHPFFVKIGANDGVTADPCTRFLVDGNAWRGLLVEPVPYLFEKLRRNFPDESRFQLVQAAIGGNSGTTAFYFVDPAVEKAIPRIPKWYDKVGSFSREHLTKHLGQEIEPYIRERQLDVVPLSDLVASYKIPSIEFLHIDAEGYDFEVLKSFKFGVQDPLTILLEQKHLSNGDRIELLKFLDAHGYNAFPFGGEVFAIKRDAPQDLLRLTRFT